MDKVLRMCLIHDLGECFTGDIPSFSKTPADEAREERLLYAWVDALPAPYAAEMRTLYREMAALETEEAKIYKALDKLEAVIQHNESAISPPGRKNEYSLNLTYAQGNVAFSPYLTALRQGHPPGDGGENRPGKRKSSKETNACITMNFSCVGPLRFPNPPWPTATSPSARCW
ncbi:MAG: HD domain-containing protein [Oscillospiraceae bacterium]